MAHQLKVSDLLQLAPFRQARLVCGAEGLANPVRGVNIVEAPDVADWVQRGDVLLTNLYSIDKLRPLDDFIAKVAGRGLSALIIKVGLFVEAVPAEIVEAARRHRLPVIEIPREVLYREIVLSVSEHLLNERIGVLEKFKEFNEHFVNASLANQGSYRILKSLEGFIGDPVALYDEDFRCIFNTMSPAPPLEAEEAATGRAPYYVTTVAVPELGNRSFNRFVFPIRVGDAIRLYLTVLQTDVELEDVQFIAIESAINALALDFLKQQAVVEVEKQFRSDLIGDLLTGRNLSADEVQRRAKLLQWDLGKRQAVAVLGFHPAQKGQDPRAEQRRLERLAQHVEETSRDLHAQARTGHVVLFWPAEDMRDWHGQITRKLSDLLSAWRRLDPGGGLRAGIGEVAPGIEGLPRSYRQALDALEVGTRAGFETPVVSFGELGIYRMLCAYPSREQLQELVPASLQKLAALRTQSRDRLLETLEAYILSNGNALETSRRLQVHPKTIVYRLDKLREEFGIGLDDPEEMLMVHVGLKIMRMLNAEAAAETQSPA